MNLHRAGPFLGTALVVVVFLTAALLLRGRIRPAGPACDVRGISLAVENTTSSDQLFRALKEIRALGFNTVLFKVAELQENLSASSIAPEPEVTLALNRLERAVRSAGDAGLRTALMPIVLLRAARTSTEWRGVIAPRDPTAWFRSYRGMILKYAEVAAEQRVDFFSVGSELVSMEAYADEWRELIRDVRSRFKGKVFYSSNWDHLGRSPAWRDLDWLGINAYFDLARPGETPGLPELDGRWRRRISPVSEWVSDLKKPLLVTEAGYPSRAGGLSDPWNHLKIGAVDLTAQETGYRSLLRAWAGFPGLAGILFYEWKGDGGSLDAGYTPRDKPAAAILEKWMQHP